MYDVAIVGTGPAGMFCALELVKLNPKLKIIMFERGKVRPVDEKIDVACGWGGAGAFSDGKLTFSTRTGGILAEVLSDNDFAELSTYVDRLFIHFGGKDDTLYGSDPEIFKELQRQAMAANLELDSMQVRHLGTDTNRVIVMNIRDFLLSSGVKIYDETDVLHIEPIGSNYCVLTVGNPSQAFSTAKVLVCSGRYGGWWWPKEAEKLGLKIETGGVDIGVRVETRNEVMEKLTKHLYEAKIYFESPTYRDRVRTFCMCPGGYVTVEKYEHIRSIWAANGHSAKEQSQKSPNCNFAVLVTQHFTYPFNDPYLYASHIAEQANMLSGGAVLQRLGDLHDGRRSTPDKIKNNMVKPALKPGSGPVSPGDLSLVLPFRHLQGIMEMLQALDKIAPGVNSGSTLLYGAEVKFYSSKTATGPGFETASSGLYVAGDGSGYTRGLLQASMMGVVVARHMAEKFG